MHSIATNYFSSVFLQNVTHQRTGNAVKFPDEEDLKGAAVALMRLQDVYKLDTKDIASGNIQGRKSAGELEGEVIMHFKC